MIAAVLLLCAVGLLCSNGIAAQYQDCVSSHKAECFVRVNRLSPSVTVDVSLCTTINISLLDHFSEHPVCHWNRSQQPVLTVNEGCTMVLLSLSKKDLGAYTLSYETSNKTRVSINVSLHLGAIHPTKPKLTLKVVESRKTAPHFSCISEGCPNPTINWSQTNIQNETISSKIYHQTSAMCCATNTEGQECSQLYDYDIGSGVMKNEVSNVTVIPGQPLILRCRIKTLWGPTPVWEKGSKIMNAKELACSSTVKKKICIRNYSHMNTEMAYLFIESVSVNHSGTYNCKLPGKDTTKSVYIDVQAKGFLSVQLDKSKIIPAQNASSTCLQANLSYHPVIKKCSWEAPNKTMTKCIRENWVTKHRTVKLCGPFKSGDYKLHLEAGGQNETKTISVCVVDTPKFRFTHDEINDIFNIKTETLLPANCTWVSCSTNDSCETVSSQNVIPDASHRDVCNKTIESSLSKDQVKGQQLMFCLTNSVGSWCQIHHIVVHSSPVRSDPPKDDGGNFMVQRVCILLLLLALAVVSVVLIYFVKKKKPQYKPQLQMIQMVGPNDNDYIYINFKDFEYDLKWEFPRENLELGQELGSGAFGMVVQATAYGIDKPGVSQQVAVKMLKEKHERVEKEALMSELKMLTHVGHHVNIVNLLGACTDTGPTYLIFQYCCYGDLLNYLKKNRENYHKSVIDAFNKDHFSSHYHNLQPRNNISKLDTAVDTYMPMHRSTTGGQEDIALLTLISDNADGFEAPVIYEDPNDLTEDLKVLTFDDLLSFAFQVAKGMMFLSSKNCIHRDLAARNVLVTKGKLVKICDFGLARDIDNDSNYVVRGNVRLPVKWMAPESTFQGVYTMKSDVWAYGILLWEIFSLGVTPYPGMKVDHTFYAMIERGFKMDCPYYADKNVYEMMCKCWALEPCNRPPFSKLVSFMLDQLTDREEKLYHNMLDQTYSDYQNPTAILDISALTKQNENKTQPANDYCRTHATEESKAELSDAVAAEEKPLKPSDAE